GTTRPRRRSALVPVLEPPVPAEGRGVHRLLFADPPARPQAAAVYLLAPDTVGRHLRRRARLLEAFPAVDFELLRRASRLAPVVLASSQRRDEDERNDHQICHTPEGHGRPPSCRCAGYDTSQRLRN